MHYYRVPRFELVAVPLIRSPINQWRRCGGPTNTVQHRVHAQPSLPCPWSEPRGTILLPWHRAQRTADLVLLYNVPIRTVYASGVVLRPRCIVLDSPVGFDLWRKQPSRFTPQSCAIINKLRIHLCTTVQLVNLNRPARGVLGSEGLTCPRAVHFHH